LLARIVGPSGFLRPIVIKRILPHLAKQKGFVEEHVDEARIVASIRHPNVVQVHELAHEGDDLYLVMEYLEGESAAALMRRLRSREEKLDVSLAVHVVAEACAGLHAAHELADADDKKLNIVHRDVTPHNIFIGFGGEIKVVDFGIATAADKISRTDVGQFKGKLEYASPEQCNGAELDRRTDIFSLGTILWELTTGLRLFKRGTQLEMIRAIAEQSIPTPESVVPSYDRELSKVVMRALSKRRRDRFQTALELRKELLRVQQRISPYLALEEDLGAFMKKIFKDRLEEKADMLRRVRAGTSVQQLPVAEPDEQVEIPIAVTVHYSSAPPAEDTETGSGDVAIPAAASVPGEATSSAPPASMAKPKAPKPFVPRPDAKADKEPKDSGVSFEMAAPATGSGASDAPAPNVDARRHELDPASADAPDRTVPSAKSPDPAGADAPDRTVPSTKSPDEKPVQQTIPFGLSPDSERPQTLTVDTEKIVDGVKIAAAVVAAAKADAEKKEDEKEEAPSDPPPSNVLAEAVAAVDAEEAARASPPAEPPATAVRPIPLPFIVGGAATAIVGILIIGFVAVNASHGDPDPAASASASAEPPKSAHAEIPPSATTPEPEAPPSASAAIVVVEPAPKSSSQNEATETLVHVETVPSHSAVLVDGTRKGVSPVDIHIAKSQKAVTIELQHVGYYTQKQRVVPDMNQKLIVTMVPIPAAQPAGSGSGKKPFKRFD
jgi:serine/threonine-protein kinase